VLIENPTHYFGFKGPRLSFSKTWCSRKHLRLYRFFSRWGSVPSMTKPAIWGKLTMTLSLSEVGCIANFRINCSFKAIYAIGGTAGAVLANRLSENEHFQVLVIEAGSKYVSKIPWTLIMLTVDVVFQWSGCRQCFMSLPLEDTCRLPIWLELHFNTPKSAEWEDNRLLCRSCPRW